MANKVPLGSTVAALLLAALVSLSASTVAASGQSDSPQRDDSAIASRADSLLDLDYLPVAFLEEAASHLTIRSHTMPGLAMAFYQLVPKTDPKATKGSSEELSVERVLFLRQDVYFDQNGNLTDVATLPLDAVEYLMHSLVLACIEQKLDRRSAGDRLVAWLDRGSVELLPEIDGAMAREYFVTAVAAFASHQLALRNEIERSYRRRAGDSQARERFCGAIERQIGLFATWRDSFGAMEFTGYTDLPPGVERPALRAEDKRQVLALLFDREWSGNAQQDLGGVYCPQLAREGAQP